MSASRAIILTALLAASQAAAPPAVADHSAAMFDSEKAPTVEPVTTALHWTNPHTPMQGNGAGFAGLIEHSGKGTNLNVSRPEGWATEPFKVAAVDAASPDLAAARPPRARRPPGGAGDPVSKAQPGDVRMIVTGSIEVPIEDVREEMERLVGHPLVIQYGSARGNLKDLILGGQAFEVAILLPDVTEQLRAAGKITAEQIDVGRVNVGIGLRGDVPPMDVSTPDALKAAILGAKALEWNPTGVAIRTVDKILDTLQIRDRVAATYHLPRQPVPVALGPGEYEIQIYPMSEILSRGRARSLGPVIPALQVPQTMCAVIGANTPDRQSAEKILTFLRGEALTRAMAANGISR